jgi:hypothetical protein
MRKAPKDIKLKLDEVARAWELLAGSVTFGGMTLEQFKTAVQASYETRDALATLDKQITAMLNARHDADAESMDKVLLVVNGVVGDPNFGPDSALYEAMGYVRKSARKSGLTRKRKQSTPPEEA